MTTALLITIVVLLLVIVCQLAYLGTETGATGKALRRFLTALERRDLEELAKRQGKLSDLDDRR